MGGQYSTKVHFGNNLGQQCAPNMFFLLLDFIEREYFLLNSLVYRNSCKINMAQTV